MKIYSCLASYFSPTKPTSRTWFVVTAVPILRLNSICTIHATCLLCLTAFNQYLISTYSPFGPARRCCDHRTTALLVGFVGLKQLAHHRERHELPNPLAGRRPRNPSGPWARSRAPALPSAGALGGGQRSVSGHHTQQHRLRQPADREAKFSQSSLMDYDTNLRPKWLP